MGWKLTLFAAALAVALAVGFFIVQHHKAAEADALSNQTTADAAQAPPVDVMTVNYAPPTQSVGYPGDARGWYESTIYARVDGYVDKWFVDIGDHVKKGEVLATIDTPELDAQLQAAQQELTVSQSQVEVADANAAFAKSTYERWRDSPKGVVSEQEREEKKAEYNSGEAQLQAAKAKVSADQADVDRLNALKNYKQVTAPFDGVVTARHIDIGDLVTAGSTANTTSLYAVAQIDRIRVFVDVPQRVSAGMEVGVPATATTNEFPGRKFEGKIARTSNAIDPQTRTLRVEVDIDNPDGALLPGMYMEVMFQIAHGELVQVPASALLFRAAGPQVAVVNSQGNVTFRNVDIAVDNGDFVQLRSGVSAGEKVALNLSSEISEGERVTAMDIDEQNKTAQTPPSPSVAANDQQQN